MTFSFKTRFAPSPTGYLHLGHVYSATCAFNAARENDGDCLIRLEDTDRIRCRAEFENAILDDLEWLGFNWPTPVRRQSEHLDMYENALQKLRQENLVYRCFKTRKEIMAQIALAPHDNNVGGLYGEDVYFGAPLAADQEDKNLENNLPFAWRLNMRACREKLGPEWSALWFTEQEPVPHGTRRDIAVKADRFGDAIIARKDTGTSYHLACVHDDGLQNITHIVRGMDLFAVTDLHVLLQKLLGLKTPVYSHHELLNDDTGKRFAKRDKAKTIRAMRSEGMSANDIRVQMKKYIS